MSSPEEKRRYKRSQIRAYAKLVVNGKEIEAHLLDLSSGGARFAIIDDHRLQAGDEVKLIVEGDPEVVLEGRVAHSKDHYVGLDCGENSVEMSVFNISE